MNVTDTVVIEITIGTEIGTGTETVTTTVAEITTTKTDHGGSTIGTGTGTDRMKTEGVVRTSVMTDKAVHMILTESLFLHLFTMVITLHPTSLLLSGTKMKNLKVILERFQLF